MSHDSCSNNTVSVEVEPDGTEAQWISHVSKNLLCRILPFFEAAFSERWNASRSDPIKLLANHCDAFSLFLELLYYGDIPYLSNYSLGREKRHRCA